MASTTCWHCHLLAQMLHSKYSDDYSCNAFGPVIEECYPDPECNASGKISDRLLYVYTCANCGYPNIAELRRPAGLSDSLNLDEPIRWLPIEPIGKEYPDVPEGLASVASEVHKCLQIGAYRAAVTLSRTALEGIVNEQEGEPTSRKPLFQRVQALADDGKLKSRTAEAATAIRLCGNASVHEPTREVGKDFAEIVVEVLDSVIDDLYTNPRLVSRARAYAQSHKKNEVGQ